MPLPVIADTFRVTFNWSQSDGVQPVNVIHIGSPTGDEAGVGAAVVGALQDHQFEGLTGNVSLETITVLALDGVTAGLDVDAGGYNSGSGAGDFVPASAMVVSFQTGFRGPQGRGRIYIGPLVESVQLDGHLTTGVAAEVLTGWQNFQTALQASSPACTQVVASYAHATAHSILNYRVDNVLGTQRRRQAQLRH